VPDLLRSLPEDPVFVTEIDDDGMAHLRFGDGDLGKQPAAGTRFLARYRVGNGPAGNVGRDTIRYLVKREGTLSADAIEPRNPLPVAGGTAPEPVDEVKLLAPTAFRSRKERAITAADYAELAQRNPRLQRAAAELRWTGSWYEARVAVDPAHTERASPRLIEAVERLLHRYRRMGHDVDVVPASYVPIALAMDVCILPHATVGGVKAELLRALGNRKLPDGRLGFFHPDNLTFGDGVWVSKLVAAAKGVDGVDAVKVTELRRLGEPGAGAPAAGVLPLGYMEIPQLDNDPNFPEHGTLKLNVAGGR
jgi:predicted phage baseplate assembly protein